MPTRRIAKGGEVRLPDRIACRTALLGLMLAAILGTFAWSTADRAGANPVTPLVVDEAFGISGATPWVSPTGEQVITYLRRDEGSLPAPGLTARIGGGAFSPFQPLSSRPGLSHPIAAFGPDGTARLVWQSAGAGRLTEQAVRPAESPPGAPAPAGACDGPAALAASSTGRTLLACKADSDSTPGWTGLVGVGQMPSAITPEAPVTPDVEELTGEPLVAWGSGGTGIAAFGYVEDGPPEEQKVAARVAAPDGSLGPTEIVDSVAAPGTLVPTGAAVLPNGTVAITADSGDGAVLFTRPPGAGQAFSRIDLEQKTASMPSADRWGRLHFLTSGRGSSGGTAWWVRVLELDGTVGRTIPVPTQGAGAKPVLNGLQVSPNGAETIVTRSDSGFFRSERKPGGGAFSVPRRLAEPVAAGPGSVIQTSRNDLLLVWEQAVTPTRAQLVVGGWDGNGRPAIEALSIPNRARRGVPIRLSVVATDPMGISRVVWILPGDRRLRGASVRARLWKRGLNRVEVAAYDRAGNRSLRIKQVRVPRTTTRAVQGRGGTSGSPRP